MFPSHWLVHPAQATGQFQQQRFLGQMHPLQQQMLQQGGAGWPAVSPLSQYSLVQQQLAQRNAMLGGIGGLGNITGLGGIGGLGIGGYGIGGYGIGGYGGAAIATEAQELAKDLMIDRSRDSRNLGIIVDLVDARSHARQADVLLNALSQGVPVAPQAVVQALASDRQMDQATDSLIRTTINDAKYNRRTDEILSNVVVGRPHVRRADEVAKNAKDDAFDCMLEQQAGALLAAAAQVNPWVGRTRARQQIIAVRDIMAPSMLSGAGVLQTLLTVAPAAMMLRAAGLGNANVIESITGSGAALPTIAAGFGGGFGGLGQAGALGAWTV
nr:hypothetical protein HK105_004102 [Polyrhizophydium stewartii]